MLLSREIANFTRGESDALRKAMGKKLIEKLNHMYPKFISGGKANGHDPKTLEKIWEDWRAFASYAFNKSHATCYSWVAYQTAYLKANYPSQYMAAVMSRSLADITTIAKLMDECKSMGIKTLGPDINESQLKFSVNPTGNIRFGMGAVKGVGEAAVKEILAQREKDGPFTSIYDLVERVNLSACNKKNLENLALAGAFDSFGDIKREQFVAETGPHETFLDLLVRYGNRYQNDKQANTVSLFGPCEEVEIAKPVPPKDYTPWSDLERLNRERDLISIYISGHPLDEYGIILKDVCTTHMEQLDDLTALANQDITFGGIVTSVRTGQTRTGKPYGIVKMEDYSGAGEVALFGEDWARQMGFFTVGNSLFITARIEPRRFKEGAYDLRIGRVEFLPDVKESKIKSISITVRLDELDSATATELAELLKSTPGNTEVYLLVTDIESQMKVTLHSKTLRLTVRKQLIDFISETPGMEYKIN